MIAVFSKQIQFESLSKSPENMFVWIKNIESIRGRTFTGVICMFDWHNDPGRCFAMHELEKLQPELFIKK